MKKIEKMHKKKQEKLKNLIIYIRPKSGFVFAKKPAIIEVHVHPVKLTVNQKPRLSDKILIKSFPSTYTAINEVLNKENFIEQLVLFIKYYNIVPV